MPLIATTVVWLAVLFAAWSVTTSVAGAARDPRLAVSGGRGLHAAAVLAVLGLVLRLVGAGTALHEAPPEVTAAIAVRTLWTDEGARLLGWAAAAAAAGAAVPWLVHRTSLRHRARAQGLAGGVVLVLGLLAAVAAYAIAGAGAEEAVAPAGVHHWGGVVARLLYLAGCAVVVVPLALGGIPARRDVAFRWLLVALALTAASLLVSAWVRYSAIAPPPELDPEGTPRTVPWTSLAALWGVPPLLILAGACALGGRPLRQAGRARTARASLAGVAVVLAALLLTVAVSPAIRDWTEAREVELGVAVHPPLVLLVALPVLLVLLAVATLRARGDRLPILRVVARATVGAVLLGVLVVLGGARLGATLLTAGVAGGAAALVLARAGVSSPRARLLAVAQAAALVLLAAVLAAISRPPFDVTLSPGTPRPVPAGPHVWQLTSQGTSQEEHPLYDGAVVAIAVDRDDRVALATVGERLYRDAHGHAGARVTVPGVVRAWQGDLRLVARGIRGDEALLQVQYHPLATVIWIAGGTAVIALLGAALLGRPAAASGETTASVAPPAGAGAT